ncbi:Alkene monooxygenase system, effector subunit [Paraburkholderia hiiakae]|uniref:Alkene monooxygenase system, effector subunit n=1 Tax=Paraburkholderia hiiakae TaxID=1081782 RepID=A0ABM8NMX0_9BURK|nr:MmoB/DmpM family protein [Paraburkholderia hiiakae]CAD6533934.1 Alkene monooxygenase system, effector subunit [Paraburkholderia hiiakae]
MAATANLVGPVLRMVDDVDAVVRAIVEDNPEREIELIDRGAYIRVQAEGYLRVSRESIERQVGRPYQMRELEQMLASFAGRIETTSDEVIWRYTV